MRISLKLLASFAVLAALVGAVGYFSGMAQNEVEIELDHIGRSAIVNLVDAATMADALSTAENSTLRLLRDTSRGQPQPVSDLEMRRLVRHQRDNIETQMDKFERSFERCQLAHRSLTRETGYRAAAHGTVEESLATLGRLEDAYRDYRSMMTDLLAAAEQDSQAAEKLLDDRLTPHVRDRMQPLIDALQQNAQSDVTRGLRNAERTMAGARTQRHYVTLASLAAALLLGFVIAWSIGRPLTKLTEATAEIAKGHLDTRVDIRTRDEIGKLAQSFNQMAAGLETTTVAKTYVDDIIRSIHEMLIVTNPQLEIRQVNPTAIRQLGFAEEELVGRSLDEILGEPVDREDGMSSLPGEFLQAREHVLRTKSEQLVPVWFTASHLYDRDGQLQGMVCVATDITDRKAAEEQLRASLREKEVLLKEVHHRVKNNLQIISSLLNLQAQAAPAKEAARALRESQSRIHSMSLIHEQLYRSDNLASIDFAEYVRELTAHVSRSVGAAAQNVSVVVEVEPVPLPIELAVPSGMIVNELVTNAMEHAFPDGRGGEIRVGFRTYEQHRELTVCDNGVGLTPPDDKESTASLGLKVVHALAGQMGGKLELKQDGGTQCVVQFGPGAVEDTARGSA